MASRTPRPAPTQMLAALLRVQLCQVLLLDQLTPLLRAVAAPTELQLAPEADLRTLHRQGRSVLTTLPLRALRAQAVREGSSGLLGEAAGHQILMGAVAVVEAVVVVAVEAAVLGPAPTTPTGSVKM